MSPGDEELDLRHASGEAQYFIGNSS
jgi:hypothetical protein